MRKYILVSAFFISVFVGAQNTRGGFIIKNLELNSKFSDFGAIFYGDNKIVFASSNDVPTIVRKTCEVDEMPYLDLYVGDINTAGEITNKRKLSRDINTKFHEAMLCFTKDGKTVYFSANDSYKSQYITRKNRSNHIQLFRANVNEKGEWVNIKKLTFNGKHYSTGHPALSYDEKRLYFVSDRPGSIGKADIFYVDIANGDHYGKPVNLGANINTKDKEMFPFICNNGNLYFSSSGHTGKGGLDIFTSSVVGGKFAPPVNLEAPINSKKDDFAFIVNENGRGYFSSNRKGGKGNDDLYTFDVAPNYLTALSNRILTAKN